MSFLMVWRLANPGAGDGGEAAVGDGFVVGFAAGTDEGVADAAAPDLGHAFAGVAAVALADGVAGEDGAFDFAEVAFVNPGLGDGHDVAAVVEHEAVAVRVAEEVEGGDGSRGLAVHGGDGLTTGVDPDEFGVAFGGLFADPGGVGFAVFPTAGDVAGFVNDPDDFGLFAVGAAEVVHADGGGADEVAPEAVVSIAFDAEVFPFAQGGSATEDDVTGLGGDEGRDEEAEKENGFHGWDDGLFLRRMQGVGREMWL